MTVTTTTTTNTYTGDGTTTAFSFTFEILETTDIKVIVVTTATGVESVRSIGTGSTNYAVTGTGNVNGGTVTFVTAPTASETVFLMRNMGFTQPTDYRTNDPFPAETHENALDRMALQIQQISRRLDRALLRPESDTTSGALPHNIDLKGGVLKFNSSSGVPEADSTLTSVATTSVNGLMSSSDKAKLDGIEASATTDQTASEILSAIKTVDGASSGLDADLLDGQQGSYYLDASNFSGLGTVATLNVGIGNNNIPKFTSGVVDNDFLKVDGSVIEGRSASEVVSDLGVITADSTSTLTNKTIDASQLSGTVANARLDAQLQDIAGLAVTDGGFIVGDGSNFVLETGATVRTSLGLAASATTDTTDASNISSGTLPNARLDAQLQDVAGLAVTDGNFIVGDGSNFVAESGSTARTSLGLGTIATQAADSVNIDGGAIDGVTLGTNSAITEAQIDDFNFNSNQVNVSDTTTGFVIRVNDEFVARFQSTTQTVGGGGLYLYQNNPFITFEGATADGHETNLKVVDPTDDRDITLPDATGTVLTTGNSDTPTTTTSSSDADFVLIDDGGTMKKITPANLGIGGGGIASVLADTSPQLGGTLDVNDKLVQFGDSSGATVNRLQLGASQDLNIYHDGSNSYIDQNDATLFIRNTSETGNASGNAIDIRNADDTGIEIPNNSGVLIKRSGSTSVSFTAVGAYFATDIVLNGSSRELIFRDVSAGDFDLKLDAAQITDSDKTITLPNVTGTVLTTANSDAPTTTTSSSDADFVLIDDGGVMKKITPTNLGVGGGGGGGITTGKAIAMAIVFG